MSVRLCAFGVVASLGAAPAVLAQFSVPVAKPSPATLFQNQCATCHTLNPADGPRMGPSLSGVVGRKAGTFPGFAYSPGFAKVDFTWDAAHLDAYLTDPQVVVPGAIMPYKQANADTRHAIIGYLQSQSAEGAPQ